MRFEENPDWQEKRAEFGRDVLSQVVTQVHEIADRVVPVRTGYLKSRLYSQMSADGTEGVVGDDAGYTTWVEDGHRVAYRGTDGQIHYTGSVVPPQPFLRVGLNSARIEGRGP